MTERAADEGPHPTIPEFLANAGEMGRLIHAKDWRATSLGTPEGWPSPLKAMLATLLSCPQPMLAAWGPDLLFFCNDAYSRGLGPRLQGAPGQPLCEVWAELWDEIEPIVREALAGLSSSHENRPFTLSRNGRTEATWWTFSYMPLRDANGAITGVWCISTETTGAVLLAQQEAVDKKRQAFRVELTDALRDAGDPQALKAIAAEKLGLHLQTGCVGYAEVDGSGRWMQVDHEWRAEGSPSVVGTHWLDSYGPVLTEVRNGHTVASDDTATDPRITDTTRDAFKAVRAQAVINVPLIRQGGLAVILFVINPRPRAWTQDEKSLVEEVAERTWAALQRLQAELDLRQSDLALDQRTSDLLRSESALRQSQKLEALGQLTGGVAHDFNNLLAAISSSVELLRSERLPADQRGRYLDLIFSTVGRATRLTSQLLAFARQQPLSPEVFNVDQQVQDVIQLVRPLMGSQMQIELHEFGQMGCFAEADINQFETALVNLVVNARDAMQASGRLVIQVRHADGVPSGPGHARREGDFIAISVIDTGCGIAADKLEKIFEPFYTTKEVGKGTGLGLSQVFGFAKQSGGEVEVSSTPGSGSVFTLYLARAEHAPTPAAVTTQPPTLTDEGSQSVLVVEDNDMLAQMTCEILDARGYRTEWAANAAIALNLLETGHSRFTLVFSDVVMPGMHGIEFGLLVRQRYPDLPVVLTSGYNAVMAEDGQHGFELIPKPYTFDALVLTFRKVIAEHAAASRTAS